MTVLGIIEGDKNLSSSYERYLGKQLGIEKIVTAGGIYDFPERGFREKQPDVILFDLDLPGHQCVEDIPFLRQQFADARLIVYSVQSHISMVLKALGYGAVGILCKPIAPEQLCLFINHVLKEGVALCPVTERLLVKYFAAPVPRNTDSFTATESKIINGLITGRSYKNLATDFNISINTVRFHIKNVYRKLNVTTRTELFKKVYKKNELDHAIHSEHFISLTYN